MVALLASFIGGLAILPIGFLIVMSFPEMRERRSPEEKQLRRDFYRQIYSRN
jgi:hypothetical protein